MIANYGEVKKKKIITVKNARYPENLYVGEKANFQRKVCICECPDTLKHMVDCDGCDHCMVPWPPCMGQHAPQSDWYNIVQTVKNMSIAS